MKTSALEGDSLSNLVSARLDLEMMMRQVVELEQSLSQLTSHSPEFTDGKLSPVSLQDLQVSQLDSLELSQTTTHNLQHTVNNITVKSMSILYNL